MPRLILPPAYTRRIQRLLALINEIKTNPRQDPRLLCKALGVSRAMLYKDRQVLAQVGFTFRYDRGQRQHVITQDRFLPVLQLTTAVGLTGSFPAVWLAHTGFGLPFAIFLLRNFFGALPKEMFESAYLDGASPTTAFFRLVLPLSVPAIASLVIFQFMWVWNDLLVALILVGGFPKVAPLTVTIANMVGTLGQNWHLLTAAAFVSMVLPLIVFFSLQRYFVRGILGGSIKG